MKKRISGRESSYTAPIARKTLRVLRKVVSSHHNPGISEIAADLSLPKSTTHGILAALEEAGWILRDPVTRKYTCGYALLELASSAKVRIPFLDVTRPYGQQLAAKIDQDVFVGILTPYHIVILQQFESSKRLRVATKPGTRLSIFAGATGQIFLAHLDPYVAASLVCSSTLPFFTPRSIVDPEQYLEELEKVRQLGVAIDQNGYITDTAAVAVPIFQGTGSRKRIVAALWVVGLSSELPLERLHAVAQLALETGQEISNAMTRTLRTSLHRRDVGEDRE